MQKIISKSVDDWKKRRREKQKMPQRLSQSGEEENERHANRNRRINRFENSQYYIQPLPIDGDGNEDTAAADSSNLVFNNNKKNSSENLNKTTKPENSNLTN